MNLDNFLIDNFEQVVLNLKQMELSLCLAELATEF